MEELTKKIEKEVCTWRDRGYPCEAYPLIEVILNHQVYEEDAARPRYLRSAQFLALETYWYLRLIKETPKFLDMYKAFYEGEDLLKVLGVRYSSDVLRYVHPFQIIEDFIKDKDAAKGNDALYESLTLPYPSYIFALAMGAGKTVLIGAIIATEFAMGLTYSKGRFIRNALVFAPGTTIIESLRELSHMFYHEILPPTQYKAVIPNLKISYASESKDIAAIPGSSYNLIVTNTEKIILRKRTRKNSLKYEQDKLEENLRFKRIASLPDLGVFSDEAHHTYGNKVGDELKRVRETINRLQENIVCVVNTTGTPYYKRKILKDVVVWYGLAEGIKDNVLKSLRDGVREYDIPKGKETEIAVRIIQDFYAMYKDVTLPAGEKAKIAFYFKRQEDLDRTKSSIAQALAQVGESAASILVNTQLSNKDELDEFNRLNDPASQKRVILLVAKGREGWNCPSLFACALITQQTTASNFVLQAAARCLRQVPGNDRAARVYLDTANKEILNKELSENFGARTSLAALAGEDQERKYVDIKILKTKLPKLEIEDTIKRLCKKPGTEKPLVFTAPQKETTHTIRHHAVQLKNPGSALVETDTATIHASQADTVYSVAMQIATALHLSTMRVLKALRQAYPEGLVPKDHIDDLYEQAAQSIGTYEECKETITRVLALIHTHNKQGEPLFEERHGNLYHTLRFSKSNYERIKRDSLLICKKDMHNAQDKYISHEDTHDISFHYSPYNLDSSNEREFFLDILNKIHVDPSDLAGFFFMGGLTDPQKTDFWFEYLGTDKRYHKYFPDFVLIKKNGNCCIVEIKSERDKANPDVEAKTKAVKEIVNIQKDKVKYHVIYTSQDKTHVSEWVKKQ